VDLDELIPRAMSALRPGIVAVLLKDVLDRVPRDGADVQFSQLAEDAGVAPVIGLRELEDQLAGCALIRPPFGTVG
jgi:hypothetical protein